MSIAFNEKLIDDFNDSSLFYEYEKTGSKALRDKLFEKYIYIPHSIAKRYSLVTLDYDDLYQCACLGLLAAIKNYTPNQRVKFSTYATTCVLNEVKGHLRTIGSYIKVPQRVYHIFYRAKKIREEIYAATGQYPTISELSEHVGVIPDEVECALSWGDNKISRSINQFLHEGEDMIYSDVIAIEDNSLLIAENKIFIENCFNTLSEEEKSFFKYRYYDEKSQSEIAKIMNVSQMKISRMEKKVLSVLKSMYYEH